MWFFQNQKTNTSQTNKPYTQQEIKPEPEVTITSPVEQLASHLSQPKAEFVPVENSTESNTESHQSAETIEQVVQSNNLDTIIEDAFKDVNVASENTH